MRITYLRTCRTSKAIPPLALFGAWELCLHMHGVL